MHHKKNFGLPRRTFITPPFPGSHGHFARASLRRSIGSVAHDVEIPAAWRRIIVEVGAGEKADQTSRPRNAWPLRALADRHGIVLIADEIPGRHGQPAACFDSSMRITPISSTYSWPRACRASRAAREGPRHHGGRAPSGLGGNPMPAIRIAVASASTGA